jgi:hypothetical protein
MPWNRDQDAGRAELEHASMLECYLWPLMSYKAKVTQPNIFLTQPNRICLVYKGKMKIQVFLLEQDFTSSIGGRDK